VTATVGKSGRQAELSGAQFARISRMMHGLTGISLQAGKESLVQARLAQRLQSLGVDFDQYLEHVSREQSTRELAAMVDALTTNKTNFFREAPHFDYLRIHLLPALRPAAERVRFWSAGCSTGEEAYSLAMTFREEIPNIDQRDWRILATDISGNVLARAREGVYAGREIEGIPPVLLRKHLDCSRAGCEQTYRVREEVKSIVTFARLNLMGPWPMTGPFDAIFCRNVMIYFDESTQRELVGRFYDLLKPGGHLFVGHSESLNGWFRGFRYVQPAVYVK
jgi:chemotaxis protein methyltransferase CheR